MPVPSSVTVPAFLSALTNGYNINVATTTLDSAGARTFASFTRGGGMGLDEMTGSPNLTVVPDPSTFRVLPWAPGVGWVLCDEYFNSGVPFHFSPRQLLRRQIAPAGRARLGLDGRAGESNGICCASAGAPDGGEHRHAGRCAASRSRPAPIEPGYHLPLRIQHGPDAAGAVGAGEAFEAIDLPLRSIENEWGPGQVECTFAPATR